METLAIVVGEWLVAGLLFAGSAYVERRVSQPRWYRRLVDICILVGAI